ncbi:hypothetical protein D6764_04375, partial [Candidatus Woesearchaeota archaeon]
IIEDMAEEGHNVFLIPDGSLPIPYTMEPIKIKAEDDTGGEIYFRTVCMPTNNGKLYIQLEGGGNKVYVKPMWPVASGSKIESEPIQYRKTATDEIEWILPTAG